MRFPQETRGDPGAKKSRGGEEASRGAQVSSTWLITPVYLLRWRRNTNSRRLFAAQLGARKAARLRRKAGRSKKIAH